MDEIKPIAYSIRFNTINNLDVFVKKSFKDLVIDSLINLKKDYGVTVFGYIVMSDHICLVVSGENEKPFNLFIERFKQTVSQKVMGLLEGDKITEKRWLLFLVNFINKENSEGGANKIWTLEYCSKPINDAIELDDELARLYQKPVDEGIVFKPEDYLYSSIKENLVEQYVYNRQAV